MINAEFKHRVEDRRSKYSSLDNSWRRIQLRDVRLGLNGRLLLLFLPMTFTGCCTYLTVDTATHTFRNDSVRHTEKAVITPENTLVVLVEGATAESPRKVMPFTIIVSSLPEKGDGLWLPREGMSKGWNPGFSSLTDAVPVAVGPPVVIPAYETTAYNQNLFTGIAGAERTLYLVQHQKPDMRTSLLYVLKGQHPRNIDIFLDGRDVKTPGRYPLLLLVPITVSVDVVTFPFQVCFFLWTGGDKAPVRSVPDKSATL